MKDKAIMMYDHIRSSVDVDPWAIKELKNVLAAYLADGCSGCAFEHVKRVGDAVHEMQEKLQGLLEEAE